MTITPPIPATTTPLAAPARSSFVTVLAAVFIVMSGGSAAIGLIQNVLLYFMFPAEILHRGAMDPHIPPLVALIFRYVPAFFLFVFLSSVAMLIASIGLLRRCEWGRKLFIAMMCLAILWNVGMVPMQILLMSQITLAMVDAPPGAAEQIHAMRYVMPVVGAVFAVVFSLLHGWIILRLSRPSVRSEFS